MDANLVYHAVNSQYSSIATADDHQNQERASKNASIAATFGYTPEELDSLPSGTNLGLSCGNPLATANLQSSETMIDLGSGGGLDCLIAAQQMVKTDPSPTGRIYGIDRSEAMIALARKNTASSKIPEGLVEFVHAPISDIPLPSGTVDLVVSNCVINLVPDQDKPKVFKEIHRLLKPGGRVAISDLLAKREMPDHVRKDVALIVGCVAGASLVEQYRDWMLEAGFGLEGISFINTGKDLNIYQDGDGAPGCCVTDELGASDCCGGNKVDSAAPQTKHDLNEWVASYHIYAVKKSQDK